MFFFVGKYNWYYFVLFAGNLHYMRCMNKKKSFANIHEHFSEIWFFWCKNWWNFLLAKGGHSGSHFMQQIDYSFLSHGHIWQFYYEHPVTSITFSCIYSIEYLKLFLSELMFHSEHSFFFIIVVYTWKKWLNATFNRTLSHFSLNRYNCANHVTCDTTINSIVLKYHFYCIFRQFFFYFNIVWTQ